MPTNIQAMAVLSHTHAHRTITAQHQLATHQHQLRASPSCTDGAPSSHLGGHRYTKAGGESSDTLAGKNHAARAVSTLPTPVPCVSPSPRRWPGAPRTSHLPRARVAAAPPPADLSDRSPRAVDIAHPATPLAGLPRPGLGPGPLTSGPPQGLARRGHCDRHLHPGLPKAPIH